MVIMSFSKKPVYQYRSTIFKTGTGTGPDFLTESTPAENKQMPDLKFKCHNVKFIIRLVSITHNTTIETSIQTIDKLSIKSSYAILILT